jgi:hypothetical protein
MQKRKQRLIKEAKRRHGKISFLIMGSWTVENGELYFWYNDKKTDSTHIIREGKLQNEQI